MECGSIIDGRFTIESLAGEGGMGAVYLAQDATTNLPVAVKVMHVHGRGDAARFVRESRILSELVHPNIVRHIAHGITTDGEPYLVMEWLDGGTLSDRLRNGAIGIRESVQVALGAARALDEAHRQGVIHRDVKPSNILCLGEGRVKLVDFGVARRTHAANTLTGSGRLLGTPGYIAPEQARGIANLDGRADLFSLGCVLHECLTGAAAFSGEHALAVIAKVVLDEPPRPSELREGLPSALDDLVVRLLSKQPDRRPEDAAEVIRELEAILDEEQRSRRAVAPTSRRGLTRRERQLVSVVLAAATEQETLDSVGSGPITPLSDALDAVGVPAERLVDGSIACVIRHSGAATDLAARAARCALALRAHLPSAPIVVATGRGILAGRLPVGEVIDRAVSTLRGLRDTPAPDGSIRLDDLTAGLLDSRFDVRVDQDGLWLTGERDLIDPARTLMGRRTPFVGRDREIAFLMSTLSEAHEEQSAKVVLITADAGTGKSRLIGELLERIRGRDEHEIWTGRGDPVAQGASFSLAGRIVRRAVGIDGTDTPLARPRRLEARVQRNVPTDDVERVTAFLSELCGLSTGNDLLPEASSAAQLVLAARRDPQVMGDQISRAWIDLLSAETTSRTLVLILDDLQWGDLPSVKLLDTALRRLASRSLVVLALARPEVRKVFPGLWDQRGLHELQLPRLGNRACERLVRLAIPGVPDAAVSTIVSRADGNPFFLEELTRAAFGGALDRLPETVVAMAQTRLDAIDPEGRQILRAASVFGEHFLVQALTQMIEPRSNVVPASRPLDPGTTVNSAIADAIARLELAEVIERVVQGPVQVTGQYRFRHALLRDAAYASLTDVDRALAHRSAADWLESTGETDATALAVHHELGGQPERAIHWLIVAIRQALAGNDLDAVLARAERATRLGASGVSLGTIQFLCCEAYKWRGDAALAVTCGTEAIALLPRDLGWYAAAGELGVVLGLLGRREAMRDLATAVVADAPSRDADSQMIAAGKLSVHLLMHGERETAERLFAWMDRFLGDEATRDQTVTAYVQMARGFLAVFNGDPGASMRMMEASSKASTSAGDLRRGCNASLNAAFAAIELGAYDVAVKSLRKLLVVADNLGLASLIADAHQNLGLALARTGSLDEALTQEQLALDSYESRGQPRAVGVARSYLAIILTLSGQLERAENEARAAVQVLAGTPPRQAFALAILSSVLLRRGKNIEAFAAAAGGQSILDGLGGIDEGEAVVRLAHAMALAAVGKYEAAKWVLGDARKRLLDRAAKISDPAWRACFLRNVDVHAETLRLALTWIGPVSR